MSGPSPPIATVKDAASFIKRLAKSNEKHFPTTSERLYDVLKILRRLQQSDAIATEAQRAETA